MPGNSKRIILEKTLKQFKATGHTQTQHIPRRIRTPSTKAMYKMIVSSQNSK